MANDRFRSTRISKPGAYIRGGLYSRGFFVGNLFSSQEFFSRIHYHLRDLQSLVFLGWQKKT